MKHKLLFLLLLIGCMPIKTGYEIVHWQLDNSFNAVKEEFERRGYEIAKNYHLVVRLGDVKDFKGGHADGKCKIVGDEREIIIDYNLYKRTKPHLIEVLMFHECAHCILGIINHVDSMSIMSPWLIPFTEEFYLENRSKLLDDLFNLVDK